MVKAIVAAFNQISSCRLHAYGAVLLAVLLCLPSFSAQAQCPTNLIHHFSLDETTQSTYVDNITPVTATCTNCPTPVASLFAGAQKFDGSNDGLSINEVEGFEWGHYDSFTMELWVQVSGTASQNRVIMGRSAKDSGMGWWVGVDPEGYAIFELYDQSRKGFKIEKMGKKINDGKWHHLVIMRHGTHLRNRLYIDGYRAAEFRYEYSDNFYSSAPVTIGWFDLDNGYHFGGAIDEVMVYNRALEENEVRSRYGYGASVYCGTKNISPTITSEPITFGTAGQSYLYDVQAIGNPAPVYSLISKPEGMQINSYTGEITWTPATTGTYSVKVKVVNGAGEAQQSFSINVKNGIGEKSGMRHHWMLHEISGVRFKDFYTPYDAVSDPAARPTPINGVVSGGQRFDGQKTGLNVSNSSNFDWSPEESFSIELWVRTVKTSSDNVVLIGRNAIDSYMHWWIGMDKNGYAAFQLLDIEWKGIKLEQGGPKLYDGKWHQIVAVKDGRAGINRLYVDGAKVKEGNFNYVNSFSSQASVNIGYLDREGKYRYEGDLDEVKLFGRALTDTEIYDRYRTVYDAIIELVRFEGEYSNGTVLLNWETQTELDLDKFIIERSEDGINFSEIGTVEAQGTSSSLLAYDFIDEDPIKGAGYYRLRIVKDNAASTYSSIVLIDYKGIIASNFFVYPNPVSGDVVNAQITNLQPEEHVMYLLSSLTGKKIISEKLQVDIDGTLQFEALIPANLTAGMYVMTIISESKTLSRKLVVLR